MMMGKQVRETKQNSPPTSTSRQFDPSPFASPEPEHEYLDREGRFGHSFGKIDLFPIQLNLVVGSADDKYEREADQVAEQVMRKPEPCPKCQPDEEALQTKPIAGQVTPLVQREEAEIEEEEEEEDLTLLPVGTTCDEDHNNLINSSLGTARDWRENALEWLEAHRDRIRNRARLAYNRSIPVGTNILNELNLLNRHFRISYRVSDLGSIYPLSANYRFEVQDFEHFGQASTPILRKFSHVDLSGLSFLCSSTCPRERRGADVHGSANPGSREFTIYTSCWDPLSREYKAFVVMHEAFHASFLDFNHDSYSFESGYPGSSPMTNADSYATFASEVTCGISARSILPEFNVSAIPEGQIVPAMERGDGELQAKRISNQDKEVSPDLQSRINSIHGGGQPLSSSARAFFEPHFGYDFSRIRVHTDAKAAALARAVNARAFTVEQDVVFGLGEYAPQSTEGRKLLAHELTHIVQQRKAGSGQAHGRKMQRMVTDPVVPVLPQLTLGAGVGRSRPNNVADVRLVQDRLHALNYLSTADHTTETPAAGATGAVSEANLTATIAAIEAFQTEVLGHSSPDGAVDAGGYTLRRLNSAIPKPTAAEMRAVSTARASIVETVTRGITLTAAVGNLPNADVISGTVNHPAEVSAVQSRLVEIGHLAATHGENPAGVAVTTPIVITAGVGRARQNQADDVRQVQARLLALGHLSTTDHATESPATGTTGPIPEANLRATIAAITAFQTASGFGSPDGAVDVGGTTLGFLNTDSIPAGALPKTRNAISNFQRREVDFWRRRGEVAGVITNQVITPHDATAVLLNRISSYREVFPTGEDIRFRDFPRSRYTVHEAGTSFTGIAAPSALPISEYSSIGLTAPQTAALRYVSSHEGNFDALNTYDRARVSFGFIQFAGGRGLPPFMALLKSRQPTAFATMFQTYGIDVEFNVVAGQISNATIVVLDPTTSTVLRGTRAEEVIRDSQRLSAVFIRAGRNPDVQRVQVEAATRDYVLPALARQASYTADIVEVLSAPGGSVTAIHAGTAARTFRATTAFATLSAAGRIRERHATTTERTETLVGSEQGLAVLMDRAIQEGVGRGAARLRDAMRWVADREGLTDIAGVRAFEMDVLRQVVDDLTADIDIGGMMGRACGHLETLHTEAGRVGATVAGITGRPEVLLTRSELDNAITTLPRKSIGTSRMDLEIHLPTQRARMNFTPAPPSVAALQTLLNDIRRHLESLMPNVGVARSYSNRVQDILSSALVAPGAIAAPAPTTP